MIILYERPLHSSGLFKRLGIETFHEEAAVITKYFRLKD
ncbi:conserved protein of unknown function [Cupriavidus taiwanensis]|uniref:Uncharacterized protein n=1 Tax=Cupriavidus taiwanensis TaxID=164546 RepID=A0A7Z7J9C0_9BURK|nr:conserved protein of unknown function [Cupriavidus taiwanensis]SOZ02966.1 conserved hypothetical protein [Cupriavidus taiwanensis]SOZ06241.1 conserved hypothetical protein [Cupriavidus taiwanensis]SPC18772.1 conserved hypothetical protein [Cupriavidus taiwanensis]SPD41140.1 conserved protein of unknown function [Cupriavidus taiwanensis]